ncbi:MAG: hypothetical protein QXL14_02355 [Candidatus Aenigmatarchaeota archaeon]
MSNKPENENFLENYAKISKILDKIFEIFDNYNPVVSRFLKAFKPYIYGYLWQNKEICCILMQSIKEVVKDGD